MEPPITEHITRGRKPSSPFAELELKLIKAKELVKPREIPFVGGDRQLEIEGAHTSETGFGWIFTALKRFLGIGEGLGPQARFIPVFNQVRPQVTREGQVISPLPETHMRPTRPGRGRIRIPITRNVHQTSQPILQPIRDPNLEGPRRNISITRYRPTTAGIRPSVRLAVPVTRNVHVKKGLRRGLI